MRNPNLPDDWVIAVVTGLSTGSQGPYAFTSVVRSKEDWLPSGTTITFRFRAEGSFEIVPWKPFDPPRLGEVVILCDHKMTRNGWRSNLAELYRKEHSTNPELALTAQECERLKAEREKQKTHLEKK